MKWLRDRPLAAVITGALHLALPAQAQEAMPDMPYAQMAAMMQMDDRERFGRVLIDQLEFRDGEGARTGVWDAQARYGDDYDKALLKTEGDWQSGAPIQARVELLWDRIITRWWSLQAGARYDFGGGPGKGWAALGIAGLAPYWLDIEATLYAGDAGSIAARFKMENDLLVTARLIVQPEFEINAYSRADPARAEGTGLSDFQAGLRVRYLLRREVAPYAGVAWVRRFGAAAQQLAQAGDAPSALQWVAGVRLLF